MRKYGQRKYIYVYSIQKKKQVMLQSSLRIKFANEYDKSKTDHFL